MCARNYHFQSVSTPQPLVSFISAETVRQKDADQERTSAVLIRKESNDCLFLLANAASNTYILYKYICNNPYTSY